jgi:anaerobic ribonucleoside-triphosphate reductase activating protein
LSGGDPLDSPDGILELLQHFRERFGDTKDVWIYTGYTFEYCQEHFKEILDLANILVDGMFDCTKRDTSLAFRGSSNQRIIDLKTKKEIEL